MYIYIHVYTDKWIYTCQYTCMYICVHIYIYRYMNTYVHLCVHMYMYMYASVRHIYICVYVYMRICVRRKGLEIRIYIHRGVESQDALSSRVVYRKRALWLVAVLRKMTYNVGHPMGLRHPVRIVWICLRIYKIICIIIVIIRLYIHIYLRVVHMFTEYSIYI